MVTLFGLQKYFPNLCLIIFIPELDNDRSKSSWHFEKLPTSSTDSWAEGLPQASWTHHIFSYIHVLAPDIISYSFLQVLEVRPVLDWDKGKAVEFLLESLGE